MVFANFVNIWTMRNNNPLYSVLLVDNLVTSLSQPCFCMDIYESNLEECSYIAIYGYTATVPLVNFPKTANQWACIFIYKSIAHALKVPLTIQ